ncbi:class I SAM-dependent methyltransferase [Ancylobacter sp. VNQ12]|uniref:class I SAM-dependent methyltransferase n=1 Tax=Ancylobacter sp. VNQ12 TaxID=3400920 RepID=UPI003C08F85D
MDRLRSSGYAIDDPYPIASHDLPQELYSNVIELIQLQAEPLCTPPQVAVGALSAFNLRMFNAGETTLTSKGNAPYRLACKISPINGETAPEGERTDLLIDLPPGRGITQPLRFRTPDHPGRYRLGVYALIENVTWLNELCSFEIDVVEETDTEAGFAWNHTDVTRDYGSDHLYALDLIREWVDLDGATQPKILEVGGNMAPMVERLGVRAYNLDVDPYGLMAGSIFAGKDHHVTNIVGDGMNLPFPDGFFDAIMMFATFHHFPDPVALLRHLKTKLAKNGQIFLMCEPVGHAFAESNYEAYVRELEHGAYEQAFLPWEYEAMIREAGLVVSNNVTDVGSAKIALRSPS